MSIKAIETVYNGYRFRSRLEARWAVFFDALGVEYRYEWEGFTLDNTPYLPDFWLPGLNAWFEVKGVFPPKNDDIKARLLCHHTRKVVILSWSDVWHPPALLIEVPCDRVVSYASGQFRCLSIGGPIFHECQYCNALRIPIQLDKWSQQWVRDLELPPLICKHPLPDDAVSSPPQGLQAAYTAARSARFGTNGRG